MEQVKPCIKVHGVASIDFQSKATAQSEVKNSTAGLEAPNVAMDTRRAAGIGRCEFKRLIDQRARNTPLAYMAVRGEATSNLSKVENAFSFLSVRPC